MKAQAAHNRDVDITEFKDAADRHGALQTHIALATALKHAMEDPHNVEKAAEESFYFDSGPNLNVTFGFLRGRWEP